MYWLIRPLLFRLPPDVAHGLAMAALAVPERVGPLRGLLGAFFRAGGPEVRAMGLRFPNPVGVAGGFDKDARCPRALAALGFGFVEVGTVTAQPQAANPAPNLFRLPLDRALINRLGFPNLGAEQVARRLAPIRQEIEVPLGVSIGKSRVVPVEDIDAVIADYLASFRAVRGVADFVVVNVSSPNTKNLRAIQRADTALALLSALAAERSSGAPLPLLLKVSPDLDREGYEALLDVVARVGLEGAVATNTTATRRDGLRSPASWVASLGDGGLSGPPLRERARAMISVARARLPRATLIGVGGIASADDARAMLDAGADLLQLYTGFIYEGPGLPGRICAGLRGSTATDAAG